MNHGRILKASCLFIASILTTSALAKTASAVPGEFVVKLKSAQFTMGTNDLSKFLGAQVREVLSNDLRMVLVQRPSVETTDFSVQSLSQNSMVEYAEPNYIYSVVGLPNDPELGKLWGMINTGQVTTGDMGTIQGIAGIDIGAKEAWAVENNAKAILVAVIDTGVLWNHPDILPNIFTNTAEKNGRPGVDDDNNGCVDDIHGCDFVNNDGDPTDDFGHGTHVTGTIAARGNNSSGVVGVAWNTTILPIKFLSASGSGSLAGAVKSIDYAIKMKANVMNNSWGGGGFSQALYDVIDRARAEGILFVAAAGNDGTDNDTTPGYPASYEIDNVVSVAALRPDGTLASFSNYGKRTVHVAAPGVNILSYGLNGLETMSGTSMACPHAAGVAALLWAQDKSQSYSTIKQRLTRSARPLASLRSRVQTMGLVNLYYGLTNTTAPSDPNDPFTWKQQKQTQVIETAHPYGDEENQTWTLSVPGAKRISVYFSSFDTEGQYDVVTFSNARGDVLGTLSGALGDVFSPVIEGDTVTMTFTSDRGVNKNGFVVDAVAYE